MKLAILITGAELMASKLPVCAIAAPARPPINVCEEEEGIPHHQVKRFQIIAAINPEKITLQGNKVCLYSFSNGIGYAMVFKNEVGDKVEYRGPQHCLERCQHFSGNNGCYGIGGIMKSIDIIKDQC